MAAIASFIFLLSCGLKAAEIINGKYITAESLPDDPIPKKEYFELHADEKTDFFQKRIEEEEQEEKKQREIERQYVDDEEKKLMTFRQKQEEEDRKKKEK